MADKLLNIPNDDKLNYSFRLQLVVEMFELNEPTNHNSMKIPKANAERPKTKAF